MSSEQHEGSNSILCTFPYEMYSIDSQFGLWRPCPRIDYQKVEDLNFNNHSRLIELRENLRNGIKDSLCEKCWNDESQGTKSYRQVLNQDKLCKNSHLSEIPTPKIFEIKFSNVCNLKCVFCSSLCSSLWEKDLPLDKSSFGSFKGTELTEAALKYLEQNIDSIDVIQIFGGEPLLHKEFYDVLNFLAQRPRPTTKKTISFSTNFFFGEIIYDRFEESLRLLLSMGYSFYLRLSIDGVGDKGEYLRTGLNWQKFHANFQRLSKTLKEFDDFGRVRCNIALNALNLLSLNEIMSYLNESDIKEIEPHYNYVGKPERFTLQAYGTRLKPAYEQIQSQDFFRFKKYKDHVLELVESIYHREPNLHAIDDCQLWLESYDKKNGKDFFNVFPENKFLFSK